MKTKKQIKKWLEAQPWYEQWLENWKEQYQTKEEQTSFWHSMNERRKEQLILRSFVWSNKKPGYDYWKYVDKEYQKWLRSK